MGVRKCVSITPAVTHAVYCSLWPQLENLILVKGRVLEVFDFSVGRIHLRSQCLLYSCVVSITSVWSSERASHLLLAWTEHEVVYVLTLVANGNCVCLSKADLSGCSSSRIVPAMLVDCKTNCSAFIYEDLFKFALMSAKGELSIMFQVGIHRHGFNHGAFIANEGDIPMLAVLCDDIHGNKNILTYLVDTLKKVLHPGPWQLDKVSPSTARCFAPTLPVGGLFVYGGRELARCDFSIPGRRNRLWRMVIPEPATNIMDLASMRDTRSWAIADQSGYVYFLRMEQGTCQLNVLSRLIHIMPSCHSPSHWHSITKYWCRYHCPERRLLLHWLCIAGLCTGPNRGRFFW